MFGSEFCQLPPEPPRPGRSALHPSSPGLGQAAAALVASVYIQHRLWLPRDRFLSSLPADCQFMNVTVFSYTDTYITTRVTIEVICYEHRLTAFFPERTVRFRWVRGSHVWGQAWLLICFWFSWVLGGQAGPICKSGEPCETPRGSLSRRLSYWRSNQIMQSYWTSVSLQKGLFCFFQLQSLGNQRTLMGGRKCSKPRGRCSVWGASALHSLLVHFSVSQGPWATSSSQTHQMDAS